jgi:hypothetical protein
MRPLNFLLCILLLNIYQAFGKTDFVIDTVKQYGNLVARDDECVFEFVGNICIIPVSDSMFQIGVLACDFPNREAINTTALVLRIKPGNYIIAGRPDNAISIQGGELLKIQKKLLPGKCYTGFVDKKCLSSDCSRFEGFIKVNESASMLVESQAGFQLKILGYSLLIIAVLGGVLLGIVAITN